MAKIAAYHLEAIPVFYTSRMVADSGSYSPSAAKPKAVVAAWQALGFPLSLLEPAPATLAQLELAHDKAYVADVLACVAENGFGNCSPAVAQSLPMTSGSMLSAARWALKNGLVAAAPCSGFHHACFAHGGGFCTFNGLMVTVMTLLAEGQAERVGILDLDQHWGNGTQDIIKRLGVEKQVRHYHPSMDRRGNGDAARFLKSLPEIVANFSDCDLVLYQAGADPHIADPLGGWMSTEELQIRDRIVFEGLAVLGIPVAWNLAGGYQRDKEGSIRPVLEIHENTMKECVRVYAVEAVTERQRVPA
jgi:acetoin utilization deacetylase AcuC-like enzyme